MLITNPIPNSPHLCISYSNTFEPFTVTQLNFLEKKKFSLGAAESASICSACFLGLVHSCYFTSFFTIILGVSLYFSFLKISFSLDYFHYSFLFCCLIFVEHIFQYFPEKKYVGLKIFETFI